MTEAAGQIGSLSVAGLFIGARVAAAGLAWGWALPAPPVPGSSLAARRVAALAAVCVCGVAVNALLAALLGEAGRFTPVWDLGTLAAACAAGALARFKLNRCGGTPAAAPAPGGRSVGNAPPATGLRVAWWRDAVPAAVLAPVACAVLMAIPGRGEWLAGGWDPGVYVNQGLALARTGRHDPGVLPAYSRMDAPGFAFFTRGADGYRECFPAVPIDPVTRKARAYFFRLMPSWVAVFARCGGAAAAVRVNLLTGPVASLALAGLVLAAGGGLALALFAALLFAVQPLFLYHLSVPTSELLQVVMVLGLFRCIGARKPAADSGNARTGPSPAAGIGAVLMCAAVLNRVSFVPFGALFLAVAAWVERLDPDRRGVARRHAAWALGLAAGAAWTGLVSRPALSRLSHELPAMTLVTAVSLAVAGGLHGAAGTGAGQAALRRLPLWWPRVAWGVAVLSLGVIARGGSGRVMDNLSGNLNAALPFAGRVSVVCALLGAGWMVWRAGRRAGGGGTDEPGLSSAPGGYVAFAAAVTALLLVNQSIAQIYPWATRRYLEFTVPLLSLLAAAIPAALWSTGWRRRSAVPALLALAVLALAVPVAGGARRAVHAWRCTAYDGLTAALDAVARRIEPGTTVVVDDPRWGTPLLLGWGVDAVNGKPLCAAGGADAAAPGMAALDALRREGRRVAFLASTDAGMGLFGVECSHAVLQAEWPPVTLAETIHSRRADDFASRARRVEFRLYAWEP